ncbi:MAG: heptaprenyl diphosphate synthase component 1 [Paenibacillus dendritiformis]|uniref:heptaprenyl diphosphate synthase component 1 n=1 Tax=Paenibacillus dendritiformis TaxID=130049 RepID=UPI00143E04E8|nr:heptaprenyl diphosphate synthase component 1 [Paenibacillus dendritiformis]MDU5140567.1 heptaprenyl diphosphate synthase component 1 [Paenibacillus dendritiformis]NKI23326.1 heptaprenyl diphosphate synthase component 1 [Paenibacillus dendritiformis]NRF98384.1 heptaprenyl diphosphate synthase component 1 [Paenibacillus dendritiformis]GIO70875.1 hypothetical protein J27TS7_03890 [Paenibacillus dendritiformis]
MEVNHISQLAKRYVEHDMIQAYTDLPAFPHTRVELMFAFLNRSKKGAEHSELIALVTSLVQVGLDTHDMIEMATKEESDRNLRSRQLKVLAGDYFSSRFYHLLAQAGQIDAIRALSQAVCAVNQLKMSTLDKMKQWAMTAEEYLRACVSLRKTLFQSFNHRMAAQDVGVWEQLLDQVAELEVMKQEQERSEQFQRFEGSWSYWHVWQQGTEEERRKMKQRAYDTAFWNAMMAKYEARQQLAHQIRVIQDKLQTITSAMSLDAVTTGRVVQLLSPLVLPSSPTNAAAQRS